MIEKNIKVKKSRISFKSLLQTLNNDKQVFDFERIQTAFPKFNTFFILSERGNLGKTTNIKSWALNNYLINSKPSLFIRSTKAEIDQEVPKFLNYKMNLANPHFQKCELNGHNVHFENNKEPVFRLLALSDASKMKGTRDDYNHIIYDEMNEGMRFIQRHVNQYISSILASTRDPVQDHQKSSLARFWLLGNYKTINHPYIIGLGITELAHMVNEVYLEVEVKGRVLTAPLCVIIVSRFSKSAVEDYIYQNFQHDFRLRLDLATNEAEHTYFNKTYYNELHNVVAQVSDEKYRAFDPECAIYHPQGYTLVYRSSSINQPVKFLVKFVKSQKITPFFNGRPIPKFTLKRNEIVDDVEYFGQLRNDLLSQVYANKVYYANPISRVMFLESLQ